MSLIQGYDPETLREIVDPALCTSRLEEIQSQRSLPDLLERVWLLKVLDRPDEAFELSEETVRLARMAGTRKDLLRARILQATVLQRQAEFDAANNIFASCIAEAEGQSWISIAAFAHQHQGKNHYDSGEFASSRESFKRSLFLRQEAGAHDQDLEMALLAIEAAERRRSARIDSGITLAFG